MEFWQLLTDQAVPSNALSRCQVAPRDLESGFVLDSRVVTDLVAGAGVNFSRREPCELKGLPGRWDLFAAS
jgi:hypothetical protein